MIQVAGIALRHQMATAIRATAKAQTAIQATLSLVFPEAADGAVPPVCASLGAIQLSSLDRSVVFCQRSSGSFARHFLTTRSSTRMYFSASVPFPANDIAFSPNGRTLAVIAYQESARKNAIWIYEVGSQGARILSDTEGASYPFWSPDGKMMAAPVTVGANFDVRNRVALFQTTPRLPVSFNDQIAYDVRSDGQRFLILTQVKQADTAPLSVVLHWAAMLDK